MGTKKEKENKRKKKWGMREEREKKRVCAPAYAITVCVQT
jgi:hypothetical protein